MTGPVTSFLVDTFVYTGILITLVLVLRRPVSRHFGPQVAYALWALPLLRFMMPPLVLPAWMAPASDTTPAAAEPVTVFISDSLGAETVAAAASTPQVGVALVDLLLPVWLGGAALFLASRARNYMIMRRELLAEARPVGQAGSVRLVETPAVSSPVAFGIRDKVVALPPRFMAYSDIRARDMAIAHELAHHRGHDLVANIAAQPLLALHWFNPLAWWGWRAMRRDQEAACDARVVAGRERSDRVAYAQVIAGFASGDNHLALAAPMACPVLGEKSIIHRLRSLTLQEIPTNRRRSGLAAIGLAALALPLTASISYAAPRSAPETREVPAPPPVPRAPEAPLVPQPPQPPLAPEAPEPPGARAEPEMRSLLDAEAQVERTTQRRMERRVEVDREVDLELDEARIEAAFAQMEHDMERLEHLDEAIDMAMAEAERAIAESSHAVAMAGDAAGKVRVEMKCEGDEPVVERDLGHGRTAIMICTSAINAQAAAGLRGARREISSEHDLPARHRERVLRRLDRQIEQLSRRQISANVGYRILPVVNAAVSLVPQLSSATCSTGKLA